MIVLALSGYRGSGKDTVATILKRYGYKRRAFADALKDSVSAEYGIDRGVFDNRVEKEKAIPDMPVIPSDAFVVNISNFLVGEYRGIGGERFEKDSGDVILNTQTGVKIYREGLNGVEEIPLYWTPRSLCILKGSVNRAVNPNFWTKNVISDIRNRDEKTVITDVRYRSEIVMLRETFGKDLVTANIIRKESDSVDPSERDLDGFDFDYIIDNTGRLEELEKEVSKKVGQILISRV